MPLPRTTPYQEGPKDAPICFVAEAPTSVEMMRGRPLVGPTGQVFDECLLKADLLRHSCHLANVSRERIASGEVLINSPEGRKWRDDLKGRLQDVSSNVLIPMGNLALWALTGETKITKWRGSIIDSTLLPGRKVIPTLHPASTLIGRGLYVGRYTIVDDLKRAVRESEFPEIRRPQRELIINPTSDHTMAFLDDLKNHEMYGFDIEIYNFQVSCISFAPNPQVSMCIPFVGDPWTVEQEAAIWAKIAWALALPDVMKIAQWLVFDSSFLLTQNKIRVRPPYADTATAHRILYPDFSSKLEYLCSIYTDEPYYKDDRKLWSKPFADPDTFYRYNARDSVVLPEIWTQLERKIDADEHYRWTYNNTMSMLEPCLFMQTRGIQMDANRLEALKVETRAELERLEAELDAVAEIPFNPHSAPQCIKYFYGIKGYAPYTNRKTGRPTCDDKALARIVRKYNSKEGRLVQQIRANKKLLGTYIEVNFDKDGRLRCMYDPRGTTTGRLSSKKTVIETGLNMQNLHPKSKYFITVDKEVNDES